MILPRVNRQCTQRSHVQSNIPASLQASPLRFSLTSPLSYSFLSLSASTYPPNTLHLFSSLHLHTDTLINIMSSSKSLLPAGMSPAGFLYPAALCAFMVRHGLTKKSLAPSGALAATFVGIGTFTNSPYVFGSVLLTFYLSSSKLTKVINAFVCCFDSLLYVA